MTKYTAYCIYAYFVFFLLHMATPAVFMVVYTAMGQGFLYGAFVFVFWVGVCAALLGLPRPKTRLGRFLDTFATILVVRVYPWIFSIAYFGHYYGAWAVVVTTLSIFGLAWLDHYLISKIREWVNEDREDREV